MTDVLLYVCVCVCSHCQHVLCGAVHDGDAVEDVQSRLPRLLCLPLQPLRQLRGHLQHPGGHLPLHTRHAAAGRLCAALCQAAQGLQGYQVCVCVCFCVHVCVWVGGCVCVAE